MNFCTGIQGLCTRVNIYSANLLAMPKRGEVCKNEPWNALAVRPSRMGCFSKSNVKTYLKLTICYFKLVNTYRFFEKQRQHIFYLLKSLPYFFSALRRFKASFFVKISIHRRICQSNYMKGRYKNLKSSIEMHNFKLYMTLLLEKQVLLRYIFWYM